MKLRTLVIDDEPLARERVKRFLRDEPDVDVIGECGNGIDAIAAIRSEKPDLVFLDIQMPEKNGFEVIKALGPGALPTIIFVTAYDQYALQAFDVYALDYILKPFSRERIHRAVARARENIEHKQIGQLDERLTSLIAGLKAERRYLDRLVVKSVGRVFFLRTDEIDWIEAAGNYVKLHVGRDSHMIRETMNGIEAKLDPDKFLRIHRSTVVNIDRIKELHPMFSGDYSVILRDNTELSLSRNYRERFLELFENAA
ncbi:MAG: response regulator transcription factor [Blastocatellia bacterium]|nr:response regulator transcription factor [Chloracidobacterium sp.]MBL8184716.1 response regulator transcription factor [Blastocatellia bacterium]HBE83555.1 DNA-binding response regulator [Blastocatellia bacterium]HRJ88652.1 LytTR family DNA-binding domain-containing protein [Pyrinomonadaceae bacterium]HRK48993.1 LytTR family DNA-binding domain-containing protein [Pyrinomonadaceae bacterium]